MNDATVKLIEDLFAAQVDGGEFCCDTAAPYIVFGPADAKQPIIFATKPTIVENAIRASADYKGFGAVCHYGLPRAADCQWIARFVGPNPLFFLGDLDLPDLMIFAWLRERLLPREIKHLGINDAYLEKLGVNVLSPFIQQCSPSEQESLSLFDAGLAEVLTHLGPRCAKLLRSKQKIEIEAIVSAAGSSIRILEPLLSGL